MLSNDFVDKFYEMDPSEEDLLFNGKYLQDNMIVLAGDAVMRADVATELSPAGWDVARRYNRWCQITNVSFPGNQVEFMAHYADGTKKKIVDSVRYPWLVKISSLPVRPHSLDDLNDQGRHTPPISRGVDDTAVFTFRGGTDEHGRPTELI